MRNNNKNEIISAVIIYFIITKINIISIISIIIK